MSVLSEQERLARFSVVSPVVRLRVAAIVPHIQRAIEATQVALEGAEDDTNDVLELQDLLDDLESALDQTGFPDAP